VTTGLKGWEGTVFSRKNRKPSQGWPEIQLCLIDTFDGTKPRFLNRCKKRCSVTICERPHWISPGRRDWGRFIFSSMFEGRLVRRSRMEALRARAGVHPLASKILEIDCVTLYYWKRKVCRFLQHFLRFCWILQRLRPRQNPPSKILFNYFNQLEIIVYWLSLAFLLLCYDLGINKKEDEWRRRRFYLGS